MNQTLKNALIIILVPSVLAGAYFGVKYYQKKKNSSTKEQFDDIIASFKKGGKDVFEGLTPDNHKKYLANFLKNVSRKEADLLISMGGKKEADMLVSEKSDMLDILSKISGIPASKMKG